MLDFVYLVMRITLILLCFTTSFILSGQFESTSNQIKMLDLKEGLKLQNDIREYYDLPPYVLDDSLTKIANKWALHLSLIDSLEISDDEFGELVYYTNRNYIKNRNKNIFKEATINWLIDGETPFESSTFLQIISEKATKIGVGIANSMEAYYIVAKYDSIY